MVVIYLNITTAISPPTEVTIEPHPHQVVEPTQLLGVTVDAKIIWKQHANYTVQVATFPLYMLRLKSFRIPHEESVSIYKPYIHHKPT